MKSIEQLTQLPVLPIYKQAEPNAQIDLGVTAIQVQVGSSSSNADAHGRMTFTTRADLDFLVPDTSGKPILQRYFPSLSGDDDITLIFANSNKNVNADFRGVTEGNDILHPMRTPVEVTRRASLTKRALFHLVNWPEFNGPDDFILLTGKSPAEGFKRCGRIFLRFDRWSITIVEVENVGSLLKALETSGGYVITHVGVIERDDGMSYSADELNEALTVLHSYFTFAFARWAGPQLVVGYDLAGDKTFESWGFGPLTSGAWSGHASWFDERRSEILQQVFLGFATLWKTEIWRRTLNEVLYWYAGASRIGYGVNVDSALLFTQAALERLAWTYCVLDRRMVSKDAFRPRGLRAADKLRMLASSLGLPLEIPPELTSLQTKTKKGKVWVDSMDALTDLRNGLVHPDKDDEPHDDAYYDAWRLSLWYIDLIILRLCKYDGEYANRLNRRWVGQLEAVPWAKKVNACESGWPRRSDCY